MNNDSGIYPVDFKVLVRQEKVEEVSKGGIVLTNAVTEKEQWKVSDCEVIALGPRAFSDHPDEGKPQVGDWIKMREYAGYTLKGRDGQEYQLINDKDIMAVVK